ncbi:SLC13 family permease [Aquimarina sediminis]|uniref:SLC13 family permease n=1 Tax=Aquimarina sediminis TaxID=2070536 RepID=UPI000CA04707|nr:SLC13 family permease [Aquimarina sediminis]
MNRKKIGLFSGIIIFIVFLILPIPEELSREAMIAAGTALLMAVWWLTEAIPVFATSFVPLVLFPLFGVLKSKEVALSYGHNYVLMLLAGIIIAKAIESQNLHKRIALLTINLIGVNKKKIILSFMISTAFLSMWIANVAVALMMLPIGLSVIKKEETDDRDSGFGLALMISIAYAASIGGIGSLIGTPPNLVFAGIIESLYPEAPQITFSDWMLIGLPLTIILLPITWLYVIKFFKIKGEIPGSVGIIKDELSKLGKITSGEKRVIIVFLVTSIGWIFRKDLLFGDFILPGWGSLLGVSSYVHDATIGMLGVLLLFLIPNGNEKEVNMPKKALISWKEAESVPWGVVILVGGGYAIAKSFVSTGLAEWIGGQVTVLENTPTLLIVFLVVLAITFLTEINSNTATANIFMPILATVAIANSTHPFLLMIPATFACSCAFMLPSGTGTNAAIFASERITIPQMAKTGFLMNFIAILIITLISYLIVVPLLDLGQLPEWVK